MLVVGLTPQLVSQPLSTYIFNMAMVSSRERDNVISGLKHAAVGALSKIIDSAMASMRSGNIWLCESGWTTEFIAVFAVSYSSSWSILIHLVVGCSSS